MAMYPSSLSFNLTSRCNLKCKFCWQYRENGIFKNINLTSLKEELKIQDLKKIISEVRGSLRNITLWGGEPMLHPDFIEFATYIKELRIYLNIITNGTLLKKFAKPLVEMQVNNLVVSVDGPPQLHDEIRKMKGSYQGIIEGIEAIKDLKYTSGKNLPTIEINFTISDLNFARIIETITLLEELSINSITISHLWWTDKNIYDKNEEVFKTEFNSASPYFKAFIQETSKIDLKILADEILKVKERKWRIPVTFLPDLNSREVSAYYSDPKNSFKFKSCLIPWITACILPNGDLTPCSDRPDFIIGNLKKESFRRLWNNEKFKLYRRVLKRHRLFPMCARCCELFRQ